MNWIETLLIIIIVIVHFLLGYSVPYAENRHHEKIKEFHKIIEKENKDE